MIKKLFSLLIFFLFTVHSLYAAPSFGTRMAPKGHWRNGVEYNCVLQRDAEHDAQGRSASNQYFLNTSYSLFEWLSFDFKLGMGDANWKDGEYGDIYFSPAFAGGYGFRVKCYENKDYGLRLVAGFQHISVHPKTAHLNSRVNMIVDDWQWSALVSKDIGKFTPYVGARYSRCDLIRRLGDWGDRKCIKPKNIAGIIIGNDFKFNDQTSLNTEVRLINDLSFSVGISTDF
jgi:hypothetical protein